MALISASDLARFRALAESLMIDTCTVHEASTSGTTMDPDTGLIVVTPGDLVYSGKVKIQFGTAVYERAVEAGGHQFLEQRYQLHFPVSAPRILEGFVVVITASPVSPHNVGRTFRVASPTEKTFATAQRVNADELVGAVQV